MKYDVFGLENPLVDLLAKVPDQFLADLGLEKNRMFLVDKERLQTLLGALKGMDIVAEPGGSAANTMLGVAQLGGKAAFCGKAGQDDYGRVYQEKLREAGVESFISTDGHLTGSTVILVTPDAARTMNTYLGACQDLTPGDIPVEAIRQSARLYITGYLWDTDGQKEAARLAMNTAQGSSIPVVMSLSDPFCVNRHTEDFRRILRDHAAFVFANQEEAAALTGKTDPKQAMKDLRSLTEGAVITLGAQGALISQGEITLQVPAFPVAQVVDTTGAGDAFAAGFLYGLSKGAGLESCGKLGACFASRVIARMGPRLEGDVRAQLAPALGAGL
ncbi:MAG: adenosine kinase [Deltaproteobacteria bacterium]|nr:adenosine kinase [Deltaproteobacteria bacterium]